MSTFHVGVMSSDVQQLGLPILSVTWIIFQFPHTCIRMCPTFHFIFVCGGYFGEFELIVQTIKFSVLFETFSSL